MSFRDGGCSPRGRPGIPVQAVKKEAEENTMRKFPLAVGGDHAGFPMKGEIVEFLRRRVAKLTELELQSARELLGLDPAVK